jgi:hypothetical protein
VYRAGLETGTAAAAFCFIDDDNAVFRALGDRPLRTGFDTTRLDTVHAGERPEYPYNLREITGCFFFYASQLDGSRFYPVPLFTRYLAGITLYASGGIV